MSRYPGTQFKVFDNSQTTAVVPVDTNVNVNDAVQYLTTFASVKGPEGIKLTIGNDFYSKYGTQDNVIFKQYGQPLFQASMNINNGAALLAKRVVLDDATLGNVTLGIALTKYKEANIEADTTEPSLISSITFNKDAVSKYSIAPIMFSIDNTDNYILANNVVNEYKERYDLYKNFISDIISNEDTPNDIFLNKLEGKKTKILSGYAQSVYYDADNEVIDLNKQDKSLVRTIKSITTGLYGVEQKTYSSSFAVSDIVNTDDGTNKPASYDDKFDLVAKDECKILKFVVVYKDSTNDIDEDKTGWKEVKVTNPTIKDVALTYNIPVTRIFKTQAEADAIIQDYWKTNGYLDDHNEYCIVGSTINTKGYNSTIRLANDIMSQRSGYIECEYIFPMFTIFDNGRGESTKSISIEYDASSSVTLKKAVYSLNIYNYSTSKRLERYSFSLNPYSKNNNTGYAFDIESAVNYNSNQISVKTYYESYDAFLETIQTILGTNDKDIISNYDILFGHYSNGKYSAFTSYLVSDMLKRYNYVYDYAHLDIFDNDILTINANCDSDNMSSLDSSEDVKYYYYNYVRTQQNILERLEFGSNGYCLSRDTTAEVKNPVKVPFIVLDTNDNLNTIINDGEPLWRVIEYTGQPNGTIISDANSLTTPPIVPANFACASIVLRKAHYWVDGVDTNEEYYISYNANTLNKDDVYDSNVNMSASKLTGYCFVPTNGAASIPELKQFYQTVQVYIPYVLENIYQVHYERFFSGDFDKDIFNLDVYFPNAVFDANYSNRTKLAIQRLAAYRGDFMCYMDMGINKVRSYEDCNDIIPSSLNGLELVAENDDAYYYIRDMHVAVTCISYKIRNPYDNRIISVTGTYGLSNLYINHYANNAGNVFAGISNGITINNIIEGSVSYIPKIYPTSKMTSLNNIGGVYPTDDASVMNEKQLMCDLRVNYGCYYDDRFSIETEYTMNPTDSEFSYWNNVALVCVMMQSIRKACPTARYKFLTSDDLTVYKNAVESAIKPWKSKFSSVQFKYVQDDMSIDNKIFYAAIEIVFKPFAQAEIFELTALNYSTLNTNITSV